MQLKVYWPNRIYHPTHGPQTWYWWRLFSISWVYADVTLPSTGHHIWMYSRWGAIMLGIYFDRRDLKLG